MSERQLRLLSSSVPMIGREPAALRLPAPGAFEPALGQRPSASRTRTSAVSRLPLLCGIVVSPGQLVPVGMVLSQRRACFKRGGRSAQDRRRVLGAQRCARSCAFTSAGWTFGSFWVHRVGNGGSLSVSGRELDRGANRRYGGVRVIGPAACGRERGRVGSGWRSGSMLAGRARPRPESDPAAGRGVGRPSAERSGQTFSVRARERSEGEYSRRRVGPAAGILTSCPNATDGALCVTRRETWVSGLTAGPVS